VRWLLSFASSFLLTSFLFEPPSFGAQKSWVEIRSAHFSVITDNGISRGEEVALHFEKMRAAFGTLMNKANLSDPAPLRILALANGKELE